MRPSLRPILLFTKAAVKYLLRATFDAPDQGFANGQVLKTAAVGVQDGQLTVVEVDGTLAISGNKCAFTAQATPAWGDLGFYSQAITRALGRGLLGTINLAATNKSPLVMWSNAQAISYANADGNSVVFSNVGTILIIDSAGLGPAVSSYSASTDYQLAIVLGGYDAANGVPWRSGQAAASYLYGAAFFIKGGAFTNWTLLWRTSQGNTATLYAAFSNYDAAGTIELPSGVPDVDLSAVLQPTCLSLFATDGELDAYTPELGSVWAENTGDWDTASGILRNTALGIATFNSGIANLIYDVKVTMPASGTTAGGLIVRFTDTSNYWYIKLTPGTANADFELVEVNAGTPTTRASADIDWVASTAYNIRVIVAGSTYWKVYVAGVEKLTYTTTNTFNQAATICGLRDEGNANFVAFDNAAVFARTSSVYKSTLGAV